MPFKSEAQRRLFYAKAARGEISRDTVREWEEATGKKRLPARIHRKKTARETGQQRALRDVGLLRDHVR